MQYDHSPYSIRGSLSVLSGNNNDDDNKIFKKPTMSCNLTPVRMAVINKTVTGVDEAVEKEPLCTAVGDRRFSGSKTRATFQPRNPTDHVLSG